MDTNMQVSTAEQTREWVDVCGLNDLVAGSGVAALVEGRQVAIFYLPEESPALYAIDNWDPIGGANVMSRGIVGDVGGRLVVASPLYKQHFDLLNGECLEQPAHRVGAHACALRGERVMVSLGE